MSQPEPAPLTAETNETGPLSGESLDAVRTWWMVLDPVPARYLGARLIATIDAQARELADMKARIDDGTKFWKEQDAFYVKATLESARKNAEMEAELTRLREALDNPEINDFIEGVRREQAHQRLRWGEEHDASKSGEQWFWLIGYLAGKTLGAIRYDDPEKARHHCVTTAAAAFNWFKYVESLTGRAAMEPKEAGKCPPCPQCEPETYDG